jgi:hypothetical protein
MTNKFRLAAAGFALATAMTLVPSGASAAIVQISGQHTSGEIQKKCKEAGGRYFEGDYTFGCTNDKKGTEVICDKGNLKCHGKVPIVQQSGGKSNWQISEALRGSATVSAQPKATPGATTRTPQGQTTPSTP